MEWLFLFLGFLVFVLILTQVQLRKRFHLSSNQSPDDALRTAAGAVGGGLAFMDASGAVQVPLGDGWGLMSVAAEPAPNGGSEVQIWMSRIPWITDGRKVFSYRRAARRVIKAGGMQPLTTA